MSRISPPVVLLTLAVGVALGMVIDRTGPAVLGQVARNPRVKATGLPAPGPATSTGASEEAAYQELARQYEQFRQIDRTFELVAKAVSPAVVHIVARKPSPGEEGRRRRAYEETGSGVIVRAGAGRGDLYVLTANHVVAGASAPEISIALLDGRVIRPDRFWTDGMLDVAVLKLGRDDLPAARLGDSDTATVGSWVLALGSPFGLTHSVSQGIISARQRHESSLRNDGVENQDFLQTDAAINPGNSGGPLVNMKGEVIGINTAIASNGGGSEGVGFSIPINMAKWAMGQLIASGKVSRAALGVNLEEVGPESALKLGLDRPRGAQVLNVHPLSPAAKAGVRDGDVVLRFGGVEVVDLNHLINMVAMTPIGQEVEVVVWREGRELARVVTLADRDKTLALGPVPAPTEPTGPRSLLRRSPRPGPSPAETGTPAVASAPDLGLELVTLDPETAQGLGLPEASRGVAVTGIEPSSPLTPFLQPLDVLSAADGQPIRTAEDAIRILTPRPGRAAVELDVQRRVNGTMRGRTIRIPGL